MLRNLRSDLKARRDAREVATSVLELKEEDRATFFSPSDVGCLPARSLTKPEDR